MEREPYAIRPPVPNILADGIFGRDTAAALIILARSTRRANDHACGTTQLRPFPLRSVACRAEFSPCGANPSSHMPANNR
jgi:hypothetical protein